MNPTVGQLLSNGKGSFWRVQRVFQAMEPQSRWAVELVAGRRAADGASSRFVLKAPQFRLFCAFGGMRVVPAPDSQSSLAPE